MWFKLAKLRMIDMLCLDSKKNESLQEKKRRYVLLISQVIVLLVIVLFSLITGVSLLVSDKELILGISILFVTVIDFMLTLFRVNGALFEYKEYGMLAVLPVSASDLIISRLSIEYLWNEVIAVLILYPVGILYLVVSGLGWVHYLIFFILAAFAPIIPMICAAIIDVLIMQIAYRFKHAKRILNIMRFAVCIILPILLIGINVKLIDISNSFSNQVITQELLMEKSLQLIDKAIKYLYILKLYSDAISYGNFFFMILFIFFSIMVSVGFVVICSKHYRILHMKASTYSEINRKTKVDLKEKSEIFALIDKEIRKFFSSGNCLLNLGIGPVFALIFCISLFFQTPEKVIRQLDVISHLVGTEITYDSMLTSMTFTIMSLVAICCYSGISLSLEGNAIWIIQSLPVSTNKILLSKIFANLILTIPMSLICSIITIINIQGHILYNSLLFILPVCYCVCIATIGLYVNLKFPKLSWNSEIEVIKQSTSSLICMLGEVGLAIALAIVVQMMSYDMRGHGMILLSIASVVIAAFVYYKMSKEFSIIHI